MSEKKSIVWKYFDIKVDDQSKAACKHCNAVLSRGKSDKPKDFSTSSLICHLRSKHPVLYDEMSAVKSAANVVAKPATSQVPHESHSQPGIKAAFDKIKMWDINSDNAERVHIAVAKMIAVDMEPYHIVEKPGFIELVQTLEKRYSMPSRKYFTERVIPDIYENACSKLRKIVADACSIAFSTDTWTNDTTTESYYGLTAHWLSGSFERNSYVLNCIKFEGHHTAANLLSTFEKAIDHWNIPREKCHLVLRDNAANITKSFRDGNITSAGCFAHTIQLCVHDGLLSQRYVSDIVTLGHKIVGHFKHSSSATDRLHTLQDELNIPHHQLIQDVATRWNSTFYMLQRLLEQRRAISLYCSENESLSNLSPNQWSVLENAVGLLQPFEELTREVSSSSASISVVIPIVRVLISFLQKEGNDAGIKTMKATLLNAVRNRFEGIENNRIYTIATLLDPRFKSRLLSSDACTEAKAGITVSATRQSAVPENAASTSTEAPTPSTNSGTVAAEPPSKLARVGESSSKLWECFDEMLGDDTASASSIRSVSIEDTINDELSAFLSEPLIQRQEDPAVWWQYNASRYPTIATVAQIYLAPPPTSVPSERLFSVAGDVITEHRARLIPQNAEKLIFLKYNASLI